MKMQILEHFLTQALSKPGKVSVALEIPMALGVHYVSFLQVDLTSDGCVSSYTCW
jgi:hypothetical protein